MVDAAVEPFAFAASGDVSEWVVSVRERPGQGSYMTDASLTAVWLAVARLDVRESATGDAVMQVQFVDGLALQYDVVEKDCCAGEGPFGNRWTPPDGARFVTAGLSDLPVGRP